MFSLAIIAALLGAVLGLRFKVMVLIPTIAVGVMLITIINIVLGAGAWIAVIEIAVAVMAVQVSYLAGAAIRLFLAAPREAAVEHTSTAAASPPVS